MPESNDMVSIRAVTASHPNWIWTALALSALPLYMALDIEGVYASALFGLRLYAVFNLRPAHYPAAALLELALVAVNPFERLFPFDRILNPETVTVHAAAIAATYVCAWLLRADIRRIGSRIEQAPYTLLLVLVALSAGSAAAAVLVEHLMVSRDVSFMVSAAFARVSVYLNTALVFGVFAVHAKGRPAMQLRRGAASIGLMLAVALVLMLTYRLFDLSGNLSVVFLFLLLLLLLSAYFSFRHGPLSALAASTTCIVLFSSFHDGWSLNTWHVNSVYLLLFTVSCLFVAIYAERLRASERGLIESAQREGNLIRNLQELELTLKARNAEYVNGIIRSLHDDVGQDLVAANLYMRVLQGRTQDAGALEAAGKASEMLEYAEKRMRAVLNKLADEHIDFGAIHAELAVGRIAMLLKASGIDYRLLVSPHSPAWHELGPAHWRFIYRFFQESVTNLLRHSRAGRCRIQLLARQNSGGSYVVISISDSDTANYYDFRRADSMGLKNLMATGADLGGRFHHCLRPEFKKMAFHFRMPAR